MSRTIYHTTIVFHDEHGPAALVESDRDEINLRVSDLWEGVREFVPEFRLGAYPPALARYADFQAHTYGDLIPQMIREIDQQTLKGGKPQTVLQLSDYWSIMLEETSKSVGNLVWSLTIADQVADPSADEDTFDLDDLDEFWATGRLGFLTSDNSHAATIL